MNLAIHFFVAVTLFITLLGLGLGLPRDSPLLWHGQPSLAMHTVRRQGGEHALAALVQMLAAIIAMLSIPQLAAFFPHAFDRGGWLTVQVIGCLLIGRALAGGHVAQHGSATALVTAMRMPAWPCSSPISSATRCTGSSWQSCCMCCSPR